MMKLSDYLANLNAMVEKNPDLGDMLVVSACDDEGNGFNLVTYVPSPGYYEENDREFTNEDSTAQPVNAVCIN